MSTHAPAPETEVPPRGLTERQRVPELMDAPDVDPDQHREALRALSRVHALSRTGARIRRTLDDIAGRLPAGRPIHLLDAACGGGDAVVDAIRWAHRRDRKLHVVGLDLSETALEFAAGRARDVVPGDSGIRVEWVRGDAVTALPEGPFDLLFSSLFLHHLSDEDVARFLSEARQRARRLHIEDLRRTRLGYLMAWGTLRLVSRSRIAHVDGPRSVRAAWRRDELRDLAGSAGLDEARIRRAWPQRLLLDWKRR